MDLCNGYKDSDSYRSEFCARRIKEVLSQKSDIQLYDRSNITNTIVWLLENGPCFRESSATHFVFGTEEETYGHNSYPSSFSKLKYIDYDNDFVAVGNIINRFLELSDSINNRIISLCAKDASKEYLGAFFDVSKKIVFNPYSDQLYNMSFRKSEFLNDLILFGSTIVKQDKENEEINEKIVSYSFGFKNPFVLGTWLRIILNIEAFHKIYSVYHNSELLSLKQEMFVRRAERSFNRFIHVDNTTHRISLNRHNSMLTSWPYYELSSIEEIKPIRLFEKIVSNINRNIDTKLDEYIVSIAIIGHTEASSDGGEKELSDLLTAILSWYKSYTIETKVATKLKVNISNYVNKNDWPSYNKSRTKDITCENDVGVANCQIEFVDYSLDFALSLHKLSEIISKNNVVFLLDCPWLTSENLEIKKKSSLDYFCEEIQNYKVEDDELKEYSRENPVWLDSPNHTQLHYIDSQYNRIMTSATLDAGSIVRVLKDRVVKRIQKIICEYSAKKELYIFLSENEGLEYSYLSAHPLCRKELYEGKKITIFQLCNYHPNTLKCTDKEKKIFTIRLWSMLKYISIAYAYVGFKDVINNCFGEFEFRPEHYFEIYRNIYVVLSVNQDMTSIDISIKLDKNLPRLFEKQLSEGQFELVFHKLLKAVRALVEELYSKVIFSSIEDFGNYDIREAFSMNIYSCIQDVGDMMFWHKYRMAMMNDSCNIFKVSFSRCDEIEYINTVHYDKELFMDKRIYDLVLLSAERNDSFSSSLKSMLFSGEETFGIENIPRQVVQNIVEECEKIGADAEKLKWNVVDSLKEMY